MLNNNNFFSLPQNVFKIINQSQFCRVSISHNMYILTNCFKEREWEIITMQFLHLFMQRAKKHIQVWSDSESDSILSQAFDPS